jgi:uncharacterized protein
MPHVSLITLGVSDVARATAFYESLGFLRSEGASQEEVSFLDAGNMVLSLFGRDARKEDADAASVWSGNGGIALAQNLASERDVDDFMVLAERAGATILKRAAPTYWGGYSFYFADPDGHVWEVAYNPHFPIDGAGRITLPE